MKPFRKVILRNQYDNDSYNENTDDWEVVICECGCMEFRVIITDHYETSAKCIKCGLMGIVHEG